MWHMKENMTRIEAESPAEGFSLVENATSWMDEVVVWSSVMRGPSGDALVLYATYVNPEGEQVDVDAFRPTYEELEVEMYFTDELPED